MNKRIKNNFDEITRNIVTLNTLEWKAKVGTGNRQSLDPISISPSGTRPFSAEFYHSMKK